MTTPAIGTRVRSLRTSRVYTVAEHMDAVDGFRAHNGLTGDAYFETEHEGWTWERVS